MSRIMVLGYELPALAAGAIEARSYRTWQFVEPLLDVAVDVRLVSSPTDDACVPATSRPRAVLDTCVKVQKGTAPFSRHGRARVSQNVLAKQEGRLSFSRCLVRLGAGKLLDVVGACLSTLFADIKSAT